jgi:ribosomal protein S18 acetylase RimI-like enzyme
MNVNENFLIVMNRDLLDMDLLRTADDSLPRVIRHMGTSLPFVGMLGSQVIASCLVEAMDGYHDIVNFAVAQQEQNKGYGRELLAYVLSYLRSNGGRFVDIGCGNADIRLYTMFQRAGFRVIGVWPDYLIDDSKTANVENSIVNRDMVRFRADLQEKKLSTTGYDASGRT